MTSLKTFAGGLSLLLGSAAGCVGSPMDDTAAADEPLGESRQAEQAAATSLSSPATTAPQPSCGPCPPGFVSQSFPFDFGRATPQGFYGPSSQGFYGPSSQGFYGPSSQGFYGPSYAWSGSMYGTTYGGAWNGWGSTPSSLWNHGYNTPWTSAMGPTSFPATWGASSAQSPVVGATVCVCLDAGSSGAGGAGSHG